MPCGWYHKYTHPSLAIREAVGNALIHQDYAIPRNGLVVEILDGEITDGPANIRICRKREKSFHTVFSTFHLCQVKDCGCGARQELRLSKQSCSSPTAATRSARFICPRLWHFHGKHAGCSGITKNNQPEYGWLF